MITEEIFTEHTLENLIRHIQNYYGIYKEIPEINDETEVQFVFHTPRRDQDRLQFLGKKIVVTIPLSDYPSDFTCIGINGLEKNFGGARGYVEIPRGDPNDVGCTCCDCDPMPNEIPNEPKEIEYETALLHPVHTVTLKPEKKPRKRGIEKHVHHLQKSQQRKKHLKKQQSHNLQRALDKHDY